MTVPAELFERLPLDLEEWREKGSSLRESFRTARPFPHAVVDGFLPEDVARAIVDAFPGPEHGGFLQPDNRFQINKLGRTQDSGLSGISPVIRYALAELNGLSFLEFLANLTGIKGLIPDPHFLGGALHQILPGGKLAIHSDFNWDDRRSLVRCLNVLIYLNLDWCDSYGGHLELWDRSMSECQVRIAPTFNRAVIFETSDTSYHGHPDPLRCPEGRTRKSLALYYYRALKPGESPPDAPMGWQVRPGTDDSVP